ncbi:MAG: SDR family NAD(P)-dependent oxidoreductase [Pseudomonadota bacterium]
MNDRREYSGRTALITGASAGLGKAFCEYYAERGADIVLVARRQDKLKLVAADLEQRFRTATHVIPLDLSRLDAREAALLAVSEAGLNIDILINNAGFTIADRFVDTEWQRQQDLAMAMMVNVASFCHAFLPGMLERGWGRIINVASNLAWSPAGIGHTQYPASKAYVMRLSQGLFQETRGTGVNVTAACPGALNIIGLLEVGFRGSGAGGSDIYACASGFLKQALRETHDIGL